MESVLGNGKDTCRQLCMAPCFELHHSNLETSRADALCFSRGRV